MNVIDRCYQLGKLITPSVQLMLYLDYLDIDDFYYACARTALSAKEVFESKCGNTQQALSYLLDFSDQKIDDRDLSDIPSDRAQYIELQGIDINDTFTNTGHGFILLYEDGNWIMFDSYIGCRDFTCKVVNIEYIQFVLSKIETQFNDDLWRGLTGCKSDDDLTTKISIFMSQYKWTFEKINERFNELVKSALNRLENEETGISDEYLAILSPTLSKDEACGYLESLQELTGIIA